MSKLMYVVDLTSSRSSSLFRAACRR